MTSTLKAEAVNHWMLIRFTTERLTDALTVSAAERQIDELVSDLPLRCNVALSFAGVSHVSSQVIGLLLGLREQIHRKHGNLVLCKAGKHVLDVLRITRLDRQFTFSDSVSQITGKRKSAHGSARDVDWVH